MVFIENPVDLLVAADQVDRTLLRYFTEQVHERLKAGVGGGQIRYGRQEVNSSSPYIHLNLHATNEIPQPLQVDIHLLKKNGQLRLITKNCRADDSVRPDQLPRELFPYVEVDRSQPYVNIANSKDADNLIPWVAIYLQNCLDRPSKRDGWSHAEIQVRAHLMRTDSPEWINWLIVPGTEDEVDLALPSECIAIEYQSDYFHGYQQRKRTDKAKAKRLRDCGWSVIWAWDHALIDRGKFKSGFKAHWEKINEALGQVRGGKSFVEIA